MAEFFTSLCRASNYYLPLASNNKPNRRSVKSFVSTWRSVENTRITRWHEQLRRTVE